MIQFKGGDGSGKNEAIIILGPNNEREGVDAEYDYIERKFGDFEIESQTFIDDGDKQYDMMNISYALNEKKKELWFDISDFY
ncbi:MAG: hypothetical protein IPM56_04070 [Ignavibacteriales bacterium]|nr:MAG: hypothetical protein IPM56_04070 [Ignavibacteriales bacterium]